MVARKISDVWSAARIVSANLEPFPEIPPEIRLVQRFLQSEISSDYELVGMLGVGVGVHHAGLSDETRALIEWLAEKGSLRVLCATTTLAQGINFPVGSVFLASRNYFYGREMDSRAFWNLAGRAGRMNQESVGVVGLAAGDDPDPVRRYVCRATGDLVSRLIELLDEVEKAGKLNDLSMIIQGEQWADFRSYIAHLWNEKKNLELVLAETEQLLRNTFGYGVLRSRPGEGARQKSEALIEATRNYARRIAQNPQYAALADATGFAPEGVAEAISGIGRLKGKLNIEDWQPTSLFGETTSSALPHLVGIMMNIPEISSSLGEIGAKGITHQRIAGIIKAWVDGNTIQDISKEFFKNENKTESITNTCRAIYRTLTNIGPWGLSALSKIGINFEKLTEEEKRKIDLIPAMIYHGVRTEAGILMRMNSVPRSIAEPLGIEFERRAGTAAGKHNVTVARQFLRSLDETQWGRFVPTGATMSGKDYKEVWSRLSGEQ